MAFGACHNPFGTRLAKRRCWHPSRDGHRRIRRTGDVVHELTDVTVPSRPELGGL